MLSPFREQSRTSRMNPSEPEAKSSSSQPLPKIPEPPQATTTALATNYTISDDHSNSSQHAHNLLLALQHESRETLFASFEPQTVTSAGLSSGKYAPDQGPSVKQHSEEWTIPDSFVGGRRLEVNPIRTFSSNIDDTPTQIPEFSVSIPRVRSVCDVTNVNLTNNVDRLYPWYPPRGLAGSLNVQTTNRN
jgi:hypothetical protein